MDARVELRIPFLGIVIETLDVAVVPLHDWNETQHRLTRIERIINGEDP